jgi:hypothetical protein
MMKNLKGIFFIIGCLIPIRAEADFYLIKSYKEPHDIVFWHQMPISYAVDPNPPSKFKGSSHIEAVKAAFKTWENITCSKIKFSYDESLIQKLTKEGFSEKHGIVVYWTKEIESIVVRDNDFDDRDGKMRRGALRLNDGKSWTTEPEEGDFSYDLQGIVTSSLSWILGIVVKDKGYETSSDKYRKLTQDYIDGAVYLYPAEGCEEKKVCPVGACVDPNKCPLPETPDFDKDGISDKEEEWCKDIDTDGDRAPDYKDEDSDNDGIPDHLEGGEDPDNDGIPNFRDKDADGDNIPDSIEKIEDKDQDKKPNFLDTDSDEDGKPDSQEGQGDKDGDNIPDYLDETEDTGCGCKTLSVPPSSKDLFFFILMTFVLIASGRPSRK